MRRCTGWRACWKPARTACTSRAAWCAWPSKTSAWPIRARSSSPWPRMQAVHFLGIPEGDLALAQAAIYLAVAPKSDAAYQGADVARADVREHHGRARAAASAQCAHCAHEAVGLRRRIPARAQVRRRASRIWSACRRRWPGGDITCRRIAGWRSGSRRGWKRSGKQRRRCSGARTWRETRDVPVSPGFPQIAGRLCIL